MPLKRHHRYEPPTISLDLEDLSLYPQMQTFARTARFTQLYFNPSGEEPLPRQPLGVAAMFFPYSMKAVLLKRFSDPIIPRPERGDPLSRSSPREPPNS